jgi:hypothetical protein
MHTTNILLSTAILATLTACGGGGGDDNTPADQQKQPTPTATPKTALTAAEQTVFAASKVNTLQGEYNTARLTVNGKIIMESNDSSRRLDFSSLPTGFATLAGKHTDPAGGADLPVTVRSYQGFRSGVVISYHNPSHEMTSYDIYGVRIPPAQLPASGKATYNGTAFDSTDRGSLTYQVDFSAKTGEGKIEGLNRYGSISLHKGKFGDSNNNESSLIYADASTAQGQSMKYAAWLAGYGAEEVVGYVENDDEPLAGFLGERGDISQ